MARYKNYHYEEYTFVFKYEDEPADMLHIWARHMKTVDDAVEVWFEGTKELWNNECARFETSTDTECVFWTWIDEPGKVVMIISCFDI